MMDNLTRKRINGALQSGKLDAPFRADFSDMLERNSSDTLDSPVSYFAHGRRGMSIGGLGSSPSSSVYTGHTTYREVLGFVENHQLRYFQKSRQLRPQG